ncbi:unnamed protein product [Mytilus edulis]|uniref:Ig-like domain-containing protein n=1 Tax=Mytilus edulis TaxID=6550 RepID=A0A8S3TP02_MYTED|nr:unnamed protein product [Mytilus edulis]
MSLIHNPSSKSSSLETTKLTQKPDIHRSAVQRRDRTKSTNEVYSNIKNNKVYNNSNNMTGVFIVTMILIYGFSIGFILFVCPVFLPSDKIVIFHENDDTQIECGVRGPSVIWSVEWFKDGKKVPEKNYATSDDESKITLFIKDALKKDEGVYKCVVKNRSGFPVKQVTHCFRRMENERYQDSINKRYGKSERYFAIVKLCDSSRSIRSHITNHPHFRKLKLISSVSSTCNIHDFPLSPAKQEEVASKYLRHKDVKIIMGIEPGKIEYIDIFPLLCESLSKLLEMDESVEVDEFFKSPFEVLLKVFQHIKSSKTEIYALMSLFLVCNNALEKRIFGTKPFKDKCRIIAHYCKIPNFSEKDIKQLFIKLQKYKQREIFNNDITFTAFANRQLQYKVYRDKFISYCTQNDELKKHILLLSYKATSPLLEVAAQGYDDILNMLIKMHLDVNVFDESGDTPLHKAAAFGNIRSLDLLLNNGADPHRLNKSAQSPLFKAVERGCLKVARKLLEKNVEVDLKNSTGETPLYVAAREGHTNMTKSLLQNKRKKANPKIFDEYIGSPLHISSKENFTDIMTLLLEEGADPNLSTNHIESPLYIASLNGKTEAVKLLIEKKADLNKCGKDGRSPLCKAAWNGYREAVEILLKNDADPNKISEYNESPLYKAARCGHLEIVKMLLEKGAKVDQACKDGRTPLYKAAWKNKYEVVEILLSNNADPNLWSIYFGTPLYRAAKERHVETVKMLLENIKTDVNIRSKDGETALFAAAKFGYRDVIKMLVAKGADMNITNDDGKTPIKAAQEMEHLKTVELLNEKLKTVNTHTQ